MVLYSLDSVRVPEQLWEMLQLLAGEGIYRSAAFSKGDGSNSLCLFHSILGHQFRAYTGGSFVSLCGRRDTSETFPFESLL